MQGRNDHTTPQGQFREAPKASNLTSGNAMAGDVRSEHGASLRGRANRGNPTTEWPRSVFDVSCFADDFGVEEGWY